MRCLLVILVVSSACAILQCSRPCGSVPILAQDPTCPRSPPSSGRPCDQGRVDCHYGDICRCATAETCACRAGLWACTNAHEDCDF